MKARVRRSAVLVLVVLVVLGVAGVAAATARASAAVDEGAAEKDSLTCLLEQFAMCEEACTYAEGYGVTFKVPERFVFDEEYSVDEDCLCWRHDTLPAILGVFEMSFDESLGDAELLAELEAASHGLAVDVYQGWQGFQSCDRLQP